MVWTPWKRSAPTPSQPRPSMYAYDAVFAEVAVGACLGRVRVRRMLGVFDAGASSAPARRQPGHRCQGRRNRRNPARTHRHRPPRRPYRQREPRRLPRPRQCRRPRPEGHLARRRRRRSRPHRHRGPGRSGPGRCGTRPHQRRLPRHRQLRARPAHHRRVSALNPVPSPGAAVHDTPLFTGWSAPLPGDPPTLNIADTLPSPGAAKAPFRARHRRADQRQRTTAPRHRTGRGRRRQRGRQRVR